MRGNRAGQRKDLAGQPGRSNAGGGRTLLVAVLCLALELTGEPACADEWTVSLPAASGTGNSIVISGAVYAEDALTLLIRSPDQRLWRVARADVRDHALLPETLSSLDRDALSTRLQNEFPELRFVSTDHYLIGHDIEPEQLRQAKRVLEQAHRAFFEHCRSIELPAFEPKHPLVVLLFRDEQPFRSFLKSELQGEADRVIAFYGLTSNRVAVRIGDSDSLDSNSTYVSPRNGLDPRMALATNLVHEATHQLMCNSGVQSRLAEYPLWVSEGMAMYFETADPYARNGWRRPGAVNPIRLAHLRELLGRARHLDLRALVSDDASLRDPQLAGASYSLAWGFHFFLIKRHRESYLAYLRELSNTQPLVVVSPEDRLRAFDSHIGVPWLELSQQFIDFIGEL